MQVYGYCMFKDDKEAKVGYPTEGFDGDVAGRSFHNGRFVQRLREAAASVPSITLRQGIAKRLLNGETGPPSSPGHVKHEQEQLCRDAFSSYELLGSLWGNVCTSPCRALT